MPSPTVQQPLPWWKRLLERGWQKVWTMVVIVSTVVTLLGLPLIFPEMLSYYGSWLQERYQHVRGWFSALDPRLVYIPFGVVLGVGGMLFVRWTIVEWQNKWKKTLWEYNKLSWRMGFHRLRRAPRNIGWVTVRYGEVFKEGDKRQEPWSRLRKVWKGSATHIIFPESQRRGGGHLCFIEFPDCYHVSFPSSQSFWYELNSPTPGYQRYESNLPLAGDQAVFITVGVDTQGTGGWSAVWTDIKRAFEAIAKGQTIDC